MNIKSIIGYTLTAIIALGIGVAAGAETGEAQEAKVITKTETKTEKVVPESCQSLVSTSEVFANKMVEALDMSADAMDAAAEFDIEKLQGVTAKMEKSTPEIKRVATDFWTDNMDCGAEFE